MILLAEDDRIITEGLAMSLRQDGFEVLPAFSVSEALSLFNAHKDEIELCLLDMSLPDGTGFDICRVIRETSSVPVLFVTAADDEVHTVLALENGADDYITKPFHMRELTARIRAVLRRYRNTAEVSTFTVKDTVIDTRTARVMRGSEEVILTAMEYRLLLIFLRNRGVTLTRSRILDLLWDETGAFAEDNTLTVYIRRLRAKLDDPDGEYLTTVRGLGYCLRSSS